MEQVIEEYGISIVLIIVGGAVIWAFREILFLI